MERDELATLVSFASIASLAALATAFWLLADDSVTIRPSRPDVPAPALDDGLQIEQTFVPPADGLEAISLRLATYRKVVDGSVRVMLWAPAGGAGGSDALPGLDADSAAARTSVQPLIARSLITEWTVAGPSIEDTLWRRFVLPEPAEDIAGRELRITLTRWESGGNPPTVMLSDGDVYPEGTLTADDRVLDGDLDLLLEMKPGHLGRAAYLLGRTGYPAPFAVALVFGLVACALGFLYRSAPRVVPHSRQEQT